MSNNKTQVLSTVPDVTAKMIDVAITKIANALIYDDKANEVKKGSTKKDELINEVFLKKIKRNEVEKNNPVAKPNGISLAKKKLVAAKQRTKASLV